MYILTKRIGNATYYWTGRVWHQYRWLAKLYREPPREPHERA
jgi:hypothetical protein